ncbi:MAG: hypothetical protein ACJ763_13435 [Bdellovibrionia bacterium]
MRIFAVLLGGFFASVGAFAAECTDFSGAYVWVADGMSTSLRIQQTGCEKLDAAYDYGDDVVLTRSMIFDGVKRPMQPTSTSLEGFLLKDSVILVEGELHADEDTFRSAGKIYLDSHKNLIEETSYFDKNGREIAHGSIQYNRQ